VARNHVAVVNEDGPDLDRNEENHVQVSLHGANKDEDAVDCQKGWSWRIAGTRDRDTHWYGRDCTYPSSGWNASAAHGVGTICRQYAATCTWKFCEDQPIHL
jgi:hypothetical protein